MRNQSLDVVKVLAFVCVVCLHTVTPDNFASTALNAASRVGVPVFFAVSGYFAAKSNPETLFRRTKHIGRILLGAILFYFAVSLAGVWDYSLKEYVKSIVLPTGIFNMLLLNQFSGAYHLWFLFALVGTYVFVAAWRAFGLSNKKLIALGAAIFVYRVMCSGVFHYADPLAPELRNWIFMGLPSFALGLWMKEHESRLRSLSVPSQVALVIIGFALALIECRVFALQELYVGSFMAVVGIFALCLRFPGARVGLRCFMQGMYGKFANLGGETIMIAYVVHLAFVEWYWLAMPWLPKTFSAQLGCWAFAVVASMLAGWAYTAAKPHLEHFAKRFGNCDGVIAR